jgi:outer membrane protein OmpA-like peptidoglycan-associated protein
METLVPTPTVPKQRLTGDAIGSPIGLPTARRHVVIALAACLLAACQTPPPASPPPPPPSSPKEQRIAALKSAGFVPADDGWELSLGVKLLFPSDVDMVSDTGRQAVDEVLRTLRKVGVEKVRIEGHTDNVGSARYNAALSQRRAESVAQLLVAAGWKLSSIERRGLGFDKPVADNGTPAGRAQNRRVVITVQVD